MDDQKPSFDHGTQAYWWPTMGALPTNQQNQGRQIVLTCTNKYGLPEIWLCQFQRSISMYQYHRLSHWKAIFFPLYPVSGHMNGQNANPNGLMSNFLGTQRMNWMRWFWPRHTLRHPENGHLTVGRLQKFCGRKSMIAHVVRCLSSFMKCTMW